MPFSQNVFDAEFLEFLKSLPISPSRFLDIGPGAGKYGAIIRKQFSKKSVIDAVEIDRSYVTKYDLGGLYNRIDIFDVGMLPDRGVWNYDVVVMGDVIEHLRKSTGFDLVDYFLYRSSWIWIVFPDCSVQIDQKHPGENHRSVWGIENFPERFIHDHQVRNDKHLVILKGMQEISK